MYIEKKKIIKEIEVFNLERLINDCFTSVEPTPENFITNVVIYSFAVVKLNNETIITARQLGKKMVSMGFVPGIKKINNQAYRGYYVKFKA